MKTPFQRIAFGVVFTHLALLVWLNLGSTASLSPLLPPPKLVAKVVELRPKVLTHQEKAKIAEKKGVKKEKKPIAKQVAKPTTTEKQERLFAEAKKRLSKVTRDKRLAKSSESLPTLKTDFSEVDMSSSKGNYYNKLALQLQAHLHLPEIGEVNLKLTLRKNGTVSKLEILETKSKRNQRAIEQNLSTLTFSPFDHTFGQAEEHSFLLTLKNS